VVTPFGPLPTGQLLSALLYGFAHDTETCRPLGLPP
jgi:hypothetical protein